MFKNLLSLISTIFGVVFFFRLFSGNRDESSRPEKREDLTKEEVLEKEKSKKASTTVNGSLNNRQKEIVKLLEKRQVLLPSDIYELHPNVSTRTLRRDMTKLVELGIVKQKGSTRDTKYILVA